MMRPRRKKINPTGNRNIVFISALFLGLFICLCIASCRRGTENTGIESESPGSFNKIYDNGNEIHYRAIDILQTQDGGYIILGTVKLPGTVESTPYLLKVDMSGNFREDTDENAFNVYSSPSSNLLLSDQTYHFFCNKTSPSPKPFLLKFSMTGLNPTEFPIEFNFSDFDGIGPIRPIHAAKIPGSGFLLLTVDPYWGDSYIFKIDENGNSLEGRAGDKCYWSNRDCTYSYPSTDNRFHITGGIENQVNYFFQTYKPFNFPDDENFNCDVDDFEVDKDSSIGRCFKIEMETLPGITPLFGTALIDRPFIALEWTCVEPDGIRFSGARIDDRVVSFYVDSKLTAVGQNGVYTYIDPEGEGDPKPELIEDKPVYIEKIDVNNQEIVFFAGSAKNNKIALYAYSVLTRRFRKQEYFGHTYIYEAAGLIETFDGGLAILGTTQFTGQYARICLFKLSREELEEMIEG